MYRYFLTLSIPFILRRRDCHDTGPQPAARGAANNFGDVSTRCKKACSACCRNACQFDIDASFTRICHRRRRGCYPRHQVYPACYAATKHLPPPKRGLDPPVGGWLVIPASAIFVGDDHANRRAAACSLQPLIFSNHPLII